MTTELLEKTSRHLAEDAVYRILYTMYNKYAMGDASYFLLRLDEQGYEVRKKFEYK